MFLSYEWKTDIEPTEINHPRFQYKIVDSEFEEVGISAGSIGSMAAELGIAVIDVYEKRNLNVAANLVRAFIWLHKRYEFYSISSFIGLNKKDNPKFYKYEADINKYLALA